MKIVILDAKTLGEDINLEPIKKIGETIIYPLTEAHEVAERIEEATVVLTNKVVLNSSNLEGAKNLKMIGLFATGFNNIDLTYAKTREIAVANVAGYSTKSVAQHTFAMLFALLEQITFYDDYVKTKAYAKSPVFTCIDRPFYEVSGKVWGIIGMGAIGKEVARIAEVFGAEVIYYSTSGKNNDSPYKRVTLEELVSTSDIISIHAPLNERTQNLIDYKVLEQMKKNALLVNVGRGHIINEEDLVRALKEDKIRGVALDVLGKEPIDENHPLYGVDTSKWLVTPHIAWASDEARQLLVEEVAKNIQAFLNGEVRSRLV